MKAVSKLPEPKADGDQVHLVCSSGHRTIHSLARVLRLNDGWCGKCGASVSYESLAEAGEAGKDKKNKA